MKVALKILDPRLGSLWPMPARATPGSAAMDVRACIDSPLHLAPGQSAFVSAGFALHLGDSGVAALLLPRSGLGAKGLVLGNLIGLIDSDYQGPITMAMWNRGAEAITIQPGDRIAQLMIVPVLQPEFEIVDDFLASERGAGGYGHSGLR